MNHAGPASRCALAAGAAALLSAPAACSTSHAGSGPPSDYLKSTLDTAYRAEGVAVFDVDHDGHLDIVTDQFWYAGPDLSPHEIRAPQVFDPASAFCQTFAVYPWDIDGDGWQDIVVAPHVNGDPMLWYRNPSGQDVHWESFTLAPAGIAELETPIVVDLFGDGQLVLLSEDAVAKTIRWQAPGSDPTAVWPAAPISPPGFAGAGTAIHGIGAGDVDGDGRLDVLTGYGWFEGTGDPLAWPFHPVAFGPNACSRMFAYDVDGDGLADVFCSRPHDYGLHVWRQRPAEAGADRTFEDQLIDGTISQMHALRLDDLDGDGVPELVSGKRFWARGPATDPGVSDPALLVYWKMQRAADAGVAFERHVIDDDSGIGAQFAVADVDGDGKPDIVTANKKGLFLFRRR